ncbi:MAG: T9SS type A sorting domain-containing protein [Bacteroidia bacterium]|nr:T9SS type A sorting domain-containing protein [Bacteroidia bacterium]
MKKIVPVLILALFFSIHTIFAQSGWVDITQNMPPIAFDTVITGNDTSYSAFRDVFFIDENEGWVTVNNEKAEFGSIYHTTDGGSSWDVEVLQHIPSSIWMLSATEGYVGTDSGYVYHTTDGGQYWDLLGTIVVRVTDIFFPAGATDGYIAGTGGVLCKINDQGLIPIVTNYGGPIYTVKFPDPSHGWWAGGGAMKRYTNGAWNGDQTIPGSDIRGISFVDTLRGIAVGDKIMRTGNGQLWSANLHYPLIDGRLNDVVMVNSQIGFAVGDNGQILRTGSYGDYWYPAEDLNTSEDLLSVYFPTATVGYASGTKNTLLKYDAAVGRVDEIARLDFRIFPNPATESCNLELDESIQSLKIMDLMGRTLQETGPFPKGIANLDLQEFSPGIYLIQANSSQKSGLKRLVVE